MFRKILQFRLRTLFLIMAATATGIATYCYFSKTHSRIINNHYEVRLNGEYAISKQIPKHHVPNRDDRLEGLKLDRDSLSAAKPFWEQAMRHAVRRNYNMRLKDDWTNVFTAVDLPKLSPLPKADEDLRKWWIENIESFAKVNELDRPFLHSGGKWFRFDVDIVNNEAHEIVMRFFDLRKINDE